MKRKLMIIPLLICSAMLLNGCGNPENSNSESEMIYVKSVSLYDTIVDIYADPDAYIGKSYHMVGTLYPSEEDNGDKFYSIYAKPQSGGEGTGLELDWNDYNGFSDYDKVAVEGTVEKQKRVHHGVRNDYLVLKVSMLEKRD